MLKLIINGDCPSKKNSRAFSFRGNRPMSFPGKYYRLWHNDALKQIAIEQPLPLLKNVKQIEIKVFAKTKRKSDLTNKAESVMDLLVDAGIIEDDNWFIIPEVRLLFGGVDPENPRVEIKIV